MSNLDLSLYRSIEALADNDIPNPILRIDFFLHAVITGEECNIEPVTKTEEYLYALATGDESRLRLYGDSISLLEEYLEALRTGDTSNLREPRTREEIILYQAITGEDLGVEPVSRIETYLSMLQNAGGLDYILSTSTNASVIPLTNSVDGIARVQEMCGDTLVNLVKEDYTTVKTISKMVPHNLDLLKPNTEYTLCFEVVNNNFNENSRFIIELHSSNADAKTTIYSGETGYFVRKVRTHDIVSHTLWIGGTGGGSVDIRNYMIFEGDWTNREVPSEYFEGMKSCGQDDENGHKIEILSQNKNVLNLNDVTKSVWGITVSYSQNVVNINGTLIGATNGLCDYYLVGGWNIDKDNLNLKPNTKYTFSGNVPKGVELYIIHNGKVMCQLNNNYKYNSFTNSSHGKINAIMVRVREGYTFSNTKINLQLEEGGIATSYTPHSFNKKEILLNEPLRGLPSGVQDRIVYLDENTTPIAPEGKGLYLEKNVKSVIFDGSEDWVESLQIDWGNDKIYSVYLGNLPNLMANTPIISDRLSSLGVVDFARDVFHDYITGILGNHCLCILGIDSSKIGGKSVANFKAWVSENPIQAQYQLEEPTYTKISDVNFKCYENATVYVDSGAVAPTKTVIRYPYKQPALFSL